MIKRRILMVTLIFIFLLVTVLGGCSLTKQASVLEETENQLTICTSFYPIYIMTLNITKDIPGLKVISLAPQDTGCLHDIQLSPTDLKVLTQSDIFIINGLGAEGYLEKVIESIPTLSIVDSSKGLDRSSLLWSTEEHQSPEVNHHTWVSIELAIRQVQSIGKELGRLDPNNKVRYTENMERYIGQLWDLKYKMHQGLIAAEDAKIITFHEAFPYFAREFGLNIAAVVNSAEGAEPNAKELADTIQIVRENKVKAIFIEPQYSDSTAQLIARETEAKVYTLDPASTGPLEANAYLRIMEKNLHTLQEALRE